MNQDNIINEIPEDIVEKIISYICDKRGYNLFLYNERKKENKFRMHRIIIELQTLNKLFHMNIHKLNRRRLDNVVYLYNHEAWENYKKKNKIKNIRFLNNLKSGKKIINYHTGLYKNKNDEIRFTGYIEDTYWATHREKSTWKNKYLNHWCELRGLLRYLKGGRIDNDEYLDKKRKRRRRTKRRKLMRRKRLKR